MLQISRSAYYKWASGRKSAREQENEEIARLVEHIYRESSDKGYRRINDNLRHDHNIHINDKRVLRICRKKGIKSTIKYANKGCTRNAKEPQFVAENLLNRDFHASKPNEKWLTDPKALVSNNELNPFKAPSTELTFNGFFALAV